MSLLRELWVKDGIDVVDPGEGAAAKPKQTSLRSIFRLSFIRFRIEFRSDSSKLKILPIGRVCLNFGLNTELLWNLKGADTGFVPLSHVHTIALVVIRKLISSQIINWNGIMQARESTIIYLNVIIEDLL